MKFETLKFSDVTINYDKKRIPLSAMERIKRQGKYRYYGAQGIIDYIDDYIFDGKYLLIAEDGENLKSKKQNIAQIAEGKFWVNNHAHIVQCNDKCRLEYLCFLLNSMELSGYITGSAQPKLSQVNMNSISLILPSVETQDLILSVILPIEQKIALNTAINENLQEQAQAIFCNMFPEILSSNGETTLEQLIVFANGKKRPQLSGYIPVYGGNGILSYTSDSNSENCVIIGRVGAYCGNTFLCTGKCWVSDNAIQAKSKNSKSQLFIFYLLSNAALPSRHIGTGQPLMTQGILNAIPILLPEQSQIDLFNEIVDPIHKIIDKNNAENKFLANIRDTLLPKLMSGEIDVSKLDL